MKTPLILFALLIAVFALSLFWGLPIDAETRNMILWDIRLPRLLQAIATGAGLSIAGVVLQAVFSNPLCEPYTLGVSSGAALGSVMAGAIGVPAIFFGISLPGLGGSLFFSFLLVALSRVFNRSSSALLLSGVMLGLLGSSLVAMIIALSEPGGVQGALFWLLGDLSRARLEGAISSCVVITLVSFFILYRSRELDALLLGESEAQSLGVPVSRVRTEMIILSGVLVAICVGTSGLIGFVGLMVPHIARRFRGALHRTLVLDSALLGAISIVLADHFSRVFFAPKELPVGVLTALLGAPLFVWIILRRVRHA